jgi:Asp-tRNA(Asn)/Glu-tRNA(Gln) amidotransferase A subunit family amidase
LLGLPAVSVPGLVGRTGLPIGAQLVGASGADGQLLAWAGWLGHLLE